MPSHGRTLRNEDMSDREMLHLINDVAKETLHGYVLANDVADQMGFNGDGRRAIAGRLIWMKRLGYLDRIEPRQVGLGANHPPLYVINDKGKAIMGGKLSKIVQNALDKADPGTSVLFIKAIAERAYVAGDVATANGTRRQWLNTTAKRRR